MTRPSRGSRLSTSVSKVRRRMPAVENAARPMAQATTATRCRRDHDRMVGMSGIKSGARPAGEPGPTLYVTLRA